VLGKSPFCENCVSICLTLSPLDHIMQKSDWCCCFDSLSVAKSCSLPENERSESKQISFAFFSFFLLFLSLFVQESGSGIGGYYSYWLRSSTNKTWNRKEKEDRLQCSHSRNKTDRETKDNVSVNIISIGHPQIKIDVRCCTCR